MFFCVVSWPGLEAFLEECWRLEDVETSQTLHLGKAEMRWSRKMG